MAQRKLFRGQTVVIHMHADYDDAHGWSLTVISRREGETWPHSERTSYEYLTAAELVQIICEEASRRSV